MATQIQANDIEKFNNLVSLFLTNAIDVEFFEIQLIQYKSIINLVVEVLILSNFLTLTNDKLYYNFPKFNTIINIFYFPILDVNLNEEVLKFDAKFFSKIVLHYKLTINK
jgi:hypothetical protein